MRKIKTDLLTIDELAAMLKVTKMWIYKRTQPKSIRGGIPHYRLGRLLRFDIEEIRAWIEKTHCSGNPAGEAFRRIQETKPRTIH